VSSSTSFRLGHTIIANKIIQYGSLWPEGHFGRSVADGFAEAVARGSEGRIQIEITPPSSDEELTRQVLEGKLAMTSGHAIQDYVPELGLGYLPYLYSSFDHFKRNWTLGSPISDSMIERFKARGIPVVVLGYSIIGFRDMILREGSITQLSDFKELKVRNDGSTTSHDMFMAFGARPQAIEYHKVKEALEKGVVDAADNTSFNLIYMQWYEATKNVSVTSHQILTNLEIVNLDFWRSLSAADQELFAVAMRDACAEFAAIAERERPVALVQLSERYGLEVNEVPDSAKAELKSAVEPMTQALVETYGLEKEYQMIIHSQSPPTV
jgi:TRAP-type C4-dicarboxylate transport system substrate-binding protein